MLEKRHFAVGRSRADGFDWHNSNKNIDIENESESATTVKQSLRREPFGHGAVTTLRRLSIIAPAVADTFSLQTKTDPHDRRPWAIFFMPPL